MQKPKRVKLTREQEAQQIWGRTKSKVQDQDEAELDALVEGDKPELGMNAKPAKPTPKKAISKKDAKKLALAEHLQPFTLHCPVDPTTSRNEIRALFSSYNPHNIRICKAIRSNLRDAVWYALVTLPNKAMALHAILTFDGTDQSETLGFTDPFEVTVHRSRGANRKLRHADMKKRARDD